VQGEIHGAWRQCDQGKQREKLRQCIMDLKNAAKLGELLQLSIAR